MKFALHLRENLVPEWRTQYLDYKLGKKKLKRLTKSSTNQPARKIDRPQHESSQNAHEASEAIQGTSQSAQDAPTIAQESSQEGDHDISTVPEAYLGNEQQPDSVQLEQYGTINNPNTMKLPPPALETPKNHPAQTKNRLVNDRSPLIYPRTPSQSVKSFISRVNTNLASLSPKGGAPKTPEQQQDLRRVAEIEFLTWLDSEVDKIENFYDSKEDEAIEKFLVLQDQLHRLSEHRKKSKAKLRQQEGTINKAAKSTHQILARRFEFPSLPECITKGFSSSSSNSKHERALGGRSAGTPNHSVGRDDYERRDEATVTYPVAKRQLKLAMSEYYRALELLKGYRALNHTGVRKMIKKFDKTTGNDESQNYMAKVSQKSFCQSDVVDNLLAKTEDMYATYFEDGQHKHAVEKLRAKEIPQEYYASMFITGLFLGFGVPLFIQAIVVGVQNLGNPNRPDVYFLFQVWGGYFVLNLMLILFMLNLFAWTYYKINYPFIFEFDRRHFLDYRQYGDIPAFLFFLMSLFGWLTFNDFFPHSCPARYFPIIYLGVAVIIFVIPLPILHWRARSWLFIACWRLLLSGLYPVEFRDFFMGDIFCSLNYSISNASFIFCLYATHWHNVYPGSPHASRCSSSKSRLLGFLNCLPGIWRFLQCLRRYADTGDWFPHLANALKYSCLILYYMFLSLLRIDQGQSTALRAVFIVFAALNAIYSSFWDVLMDWSLGDVNSKNWGLRDELAFPKWTYYVMIVLDPILRFSWVLYAAYAQQIQQSAKISFFVALIEIIRRFLWVFLRVENEHCTNVVRYRASRDLSLPYIPAAGRQTGDGNDCRTGTGTTSAREQLNLPQRKHKHDQQAPHAPVRSMTMPSETDVHHRPEDEEASIASGTPDTAIGRQQLRRRGTIASMATPVLRALNSAHVADFERRRLSNEAVEDEEDDDDDDKDNDPKHGDHGA